MYPQRILYDATKEWGIKVERVEIRDVKLPPSLQRAMAAEAEAAREARAKVSDGILFSLCVALYMVNGAIVNTWHSHFHHSHWWWPLITMMVLSIDPN